MRTLLLLVITLLTTLAPNFAQTPATAPKDPDAPIERHWKVDGTDRVALVFAHESAKTTSSPLIFAFHGHGGNMQNSSRRFGYQKLWPEAVVVYMQGLPTPGPLTDPEGKRNGWQHSAGDQNDRDLKFFDAVLASLKKDYKIDPKRIFATGHSNGGGFTYLLWAERGETFAAVAPSAATATRNYLHLKPKPALHVAGSNDELVKFPLQETTMNAIRALNKCDSKGTEWAKSGKLVGTLYPSKTGTPFISVIFPGPHVFPNEAPSLVVHFFKSYEELSKPKSVDPSKDETH